MNSWLLSLTTGMLHGCLRPKVRPTPCCGPKLAMRPKQTLNDPEGANNPQEGRLLGSFAPLWGSKAQHRGDSSNYFTQDPHIYVVFWLHSRAPLRPHRVHRWPCIPLKPLERSPLKESLGPYSCGALSLLVTPRLCESKAGCGPDAMAGAWGADRRCQGSVDKCKGYVYVYVHMYIYIYIHIYLYAYILYIFVSICLYIYISIYLCIYLYMYISYIYIAIHVSIRMRGTISTHCLGLTCQWLATHNHNKGKQAPAVCINLRTRTCA